MSNNRVSETKGLIRGGANVALSCALAASLTPTVALADTASSSSGSDTVTAAFASQDVAAIDITAQWKAGAAVISAGGRYVISEDFATDGALVVNAPAGETVVIDLAGHCVDVRGSVQAAIVVDNSQGEVIITDSSFTDALSRGERAADDDPCATLRLVATDASESVSAVRLNVSADKEQFEQGKVSLPKLTLSHVRVQAGVAGVADGLEEGKTVSCFGLYAGLAGVEAALDVSLDGCSVDAAVSGEGAPEWAKAEGKSVPSERAGIAASVATQVKGVSLAGANSFTATSVAGEAHLYATVDDAFSAAAGATLRDEVCVYANGNAADAKLIAASDENQARDLASHIVDAVEKRCGVANGSAVVVSADACEQVVEQTALSGGASKAVSSATVAPTVESASVSCGSLVQPKEHEANLLLSTCVEGSPLAQPEVFSYLVEQSVDLTKAWTDRTQPFVISESGTYYLDADLTSTKGNLQIKGDGIDVRLVLNGHTLDFDLTSGYLAGIVASGTANVSISGGDAPATVKYSSAAPGNVITWGSAGTLSMSNVNVVSRKTADYVNQGALSMHALGITGGNVETDRCSFIVDQSNLTTTSVTAKQDPYPAVIYDGRSGSSSSKVVLRDSSLKLIANTNASVEASGVKAGVSGYGVYATSQATYTFDGCSIDVSAASGSAIGVYAKKVEVGTGSASMGLSINVNGSTSAFGIRAFGAGGVLLNGGLAVTYSGDGAPCVCAALAADGADAFRIGKGFSGSDLGVLLGSDACSYNGADVRIATFDFAPSSDEAAAAAAALCSALGAQAPSKVAAAGDGLYFRLSDENASFEVVSTDGSTHRFANLSQAFQAACDGDTVRLLSDIDDIVYTGAAAGGQTVNLDLNGHTVSSLTSDSSLANLTVFDSAGSAAIRHLGKGAAVVVQGSSSVSLTDISVESVSYNASAYGIQLGGSASVSLNNVAVRAETTNGTAAGLYAPAGSSGSIAADGGSIFAVASTSTATAYGIQVIPAGVATALVDCPVKATSASTSAFGIVTSGSLNARGRAAGSQSIEAVCDVGSGSAMALRASGATEQELNLTNCSLAASSCAKADDLTGDFWCIDASLASKAQFTLDGGMSFASAAGTAFKQSAPITLGNDFALTGENRITVESSQLAGDAFAALAESADADACVQAFEALSSSAYADCPAKVVDGKLVWFCSPVARVSSTGAEFTSVSAALAHSSQGDTITLVGDARDVSAISISHDVAIDLAGHIWRVDAAAQASSGAVVASGSACLTLRDSEGSGRLDVTVGSPNEMLSSKVTYSALVNNSTGTMVLEGVDARVTYTGAATTAREVRTVGISATAGKVELSNASKLSVYSQKSQDAYACSEVVGVLVGGSSKRDAIEVDASSSIEVVNDAEAQIDGAQYIDSSTLNNSNPILKRITPDESSELYQEILEKFRKSASLDDSVTSESFGARVYRANAMLLEDGTMVWAYSDYVAPGEETLGNIKPKAIFVRSTYALEPQATGIAGEVTTNVDGTVATAGGATVRGTVSAHAAKGEASAVSVRGSGQWLLDGANLNALGGNDAFMKRDTDHALDLGDFIDAPNKPDNWFYPRGNTATLVSEQQAQTQAILLDDGVDVTLSGSMSLSASGGDACGIRGCGMVATASFAAASGEAVTVGSKTGANTPGAVICSPAEAGQGAFARTLFKDAYAALSPNFDDKGNLVWEDAYTVTFESDNGTVASYSGLIFGDSVALPSADDMAKEVSSTTSYEFLGWATSPNATEADIVYGKDAAAATVSRSVSYYPVYRVCARAVNVSFSGAKDASGVTQPAANVTADYGCTLAQGSCGGRAPAAADYFDGTATYRFVGWRDSNGMVWDGTSFDSEVAIDSNIAGSTTGSVALRAVYIRVGASQCLIRFKVDSAIKAYAVEVGERPSYYSATGNSAIAPSKVASVAGITYTFAGWHDGRSVTSLPADVDFVSGAALPPSTGDAVYTACFSESKTKGSVRFVTLQKLEDGTYAKQASESLVAEYGANVIGLASRFVNIGDEIVADGHVYKMLGWSVRSGDKEPLYTDSIPFTPSDETVTYYAVYSDTEQTASITFYDGTTEYAKVDGFGVSGTVEAAFEKTGKSSPPDKSASRVFKGWSSSQEAASANVDMTASVYSVSGGASSLNLYAVYGDAYKPTVTFVDADGNVLSRATVEAGTTLSSIDMPSVPAREGMYVSGWSLTSTGEVLDTAKALTSDVRLEPKYSAIETNADPDDPERTFDGFADVSRATLTAKDAVGAHSVVFMLDNASKYDTTLESQASLNGDAIISGAAYTAFYSIDQKKLDAAGDIGAVRINVSCGSISPSSKVRVYWKRGDGSVGYTSALEQNAGSVTFTMSSYSSLSTDGNLVVAEVGAGTKAIDGTTDGAVTLNRANTGLSNVVSGTMTKSSGASTTASSLNTAGMAASASDDAAASLTQVSSDAGVLSDAGAEDGIDAEQARAAAQRIAGNPVAWGAGLLGAGGIGAAVWWMLVGRKRKVAEDEEAGWSDDSEGVEGMASQTSGDPMRAQGASADDSSKASGGISFS